MGVPKFIGRGSESPFIPELYRFIIIIMELSQAHLIAILQDQLYESRETEKNLRRVNDSLLLALQTQSTNDIQLSTIKEIERKWEEQANRKIQENEEYWRSKLDQEVLRRKEAEKRLGMENIRLERSKSNQNSSSSDLGRLRENKIRQIQGLMDEMISHKVSSRKASMEKTEPEKKPLSANVRHRDKYKSVCQNITPLGCLSQLSNYQNTLKLKGQQMKEVLDQNSSKYFVETERAKNPRGLLSKSNQVKTARVMRREID